MHRKSYPGRIESGAPAAAHSSGPSRRGVLKGAAVLGGVGLFGGAALTAPAASAAGRAAFGSVPIHPERIGIYAIPDIPEQWRDWDLTQASLAKLHQVLPGAWVRWDNETGHHTDDPASVETVVARAQAAGLPMIITGSAVDGYDNWWAQNNTQPEETIRQIADGPYLDHAADLYRRYDNVRFVETVNEPDGVWFVANPDDVGDYAYYLDRLTSAMNGDTAGILGPATAFEGQILQHHLGRPELSHISYHTYGGWQSLRTYPGKEVYVTEYGDDSVPAGTGNSPAFVIGDLAQAERAGKLSDGVRMVFYVNLQGMMRADATENGHFTFTGQLRALIAYQALGAVSSTAWTDPSVTEVLATDDGAGRFAALLWNPSADSELSGRTVQVPGSSLGGAEALNVLTVLNRADGAAESAALGAQNRVRAQVADGTVTLTVDRLEPLAAVLVTTEGTTDLAN
ncbi:hypothetical protein AB0J21_14240 [Streptomyces sp. NPDC049954]|uniref:hypothetical protein n=1 Tax=Streptomyces sp. NPDC049954 TaxID=3155779 RepID=UPI0034263BDC